MPAHPRVAFQYRDFRLYVAARFLSLCAHQMLATAMAQYIYEMTGKPLHLGLIGLAFFLPKIGFTLLAGHAADRYDRKRVVALCRLAQFAVVLGLTFYVRFGTPTLWTLLAILFTLATAYAFDGPSSQSIVPQLVEPAHFANAVTWNSSILQFAFITGPVLGGWLYDSRAPVLVFAAVTLMRFLSAVLIFFLRTHAGPREISEVSWKTLLAGIRYVRANRIILGTISMDLFAVLLGGAVALMPVFANQILKVGDNGLGILRAGPFVGAALMAVMIAYLPPMKNAGRTMLWCVAIFGVATIAFGLSTYFPLSFACLVVLGAADMVSVIVRGVVVQVKTPPQMRGRVSAVNLIFIGASNELGEFESGVTAEIFGTVPAVVIGGIGTLLVVAWWAWRFPEIRAYQSLSGAQAEGPTK